MVSTQQVRNAAGFVGFYVTRPARFDEVWRWARLRGHMTDLRMPWWPLAASDAIGAALPTGARVFEFGGGGSTLWLADHGADVTCVEHDRPWHDLLAAELDGVARLVLVEPTPTGTISSAGREYFYDDYVHAIDSEPDESFDLVIVDGRVRVECGVNAMRKVAPGGWLLLDDSDRPRYAELGTTVETQGWRRRDFRGARPGGGNLTQTTVFVKPG